VDYCSANRRPELTLEVARSDADREHIKDFISRQFAFHFGAGATIEPPVLIGAWNAQRQLVGALGLRTCAHGFFSQTYLPQPWVQAMQKVLVREIEPTAVVEVVHLAVASPVIITPLLEALADHLNEAGFRYLVCTATRCLQRFFRKRGWSITTLAKAEPSALGADAAAWGAYYAQEPAVIVGDIQEAWLLAHARDAERISA
jgi:Thermostable hemolysin